MPVHPQRILVRPHIDSHLLLPRRRYRELVESKFASFKVPLATYLPAGPRNILPATRPRLTYHLVT